MENPLSPGAHRLPLTHPGRRPTRSYKHLGLIEHCQAAQFTEWNREINEFRPYHSVLQIERGTL